MNHRSFPYASHHLGAALSGRQAGLRRQCRLHWADLGCRQCVIYRIEGPTLRDRFFARQHRDLPPVTITSKIIRVESGEVAYHNVVTAHVDEAEGSGWSLSDNIDYHRWSREALDRGIMQTVHNLRRAFD